MYLTQKHIPRRAVLKGLGATMALPFLEAMLPAGTAGAATPAARSLEKTRLVAIEMVHGSAGSADLGARLNMWAPAAVGREFDLAPTSLKSLEAYREYLTIISNTRDRSAEAWSAPEVGGDHFRSSATFLTQAHPKQTEGSDVEAGISLDQLYAQKRGQDTPIPSMQLCIENVGKGGGCEYGYACVYEDTISWASPKDPLPMIRNPRTVFEQLFGSGATPAERAARQRASQSVLDTVTSVVADLKGRLGATDRARLSNYLDNVREIEQRIQRIEAHNRSGAERDLPEAPTGVPDSFHEHVHMMMDLMAAAFQADLTRCFAFKLGLDASNRVYPSSGAPVAFHSTSHHQEKESNLRTFQMINTYHVSMVTYLADKLKAIQEGDANLLEKSLIVYGSAMCDSNIHNHNRLPLFLLGHANGQIAGHMHIKTPDDTPMANAWVSVLQKLGVQVDKFGDSTASLDLNAPVVTTAA